MGDISSWAKDPKFLMNEDEICQAVGVIRWLLTRVGKKEINALPVKEIADKIFEKDARVYSGIHAYCMRSASETTRNGFIDTFNLYPSAQTSVERLIKEGKELKQAV